ncbi:MAG: FAD-binding oxidoreductase, partial [Alphaproteobacteria bacterium]|nr:FAD-binding oxidoreductase [Alphaproteobacteria bacterium]
MPTLRADVAIIGGGLVGCAAALSLARAGLAVTILDQGVCGSQASGVNAGGVRQQGRDPVELPLARRARALWDQLPELIGADVEFEAKGHLKLARSEAHMAELERYAKIAVPCGLKLELLGRNAVRAAYPFLGPAVVGASLCRDDGQANPRLAAGAFARAARRAGADIHEHQRVSRLSRGPTGFKVICDSGLTVQSAELVNAAGAWGGMIAAQFGETVPIAVMAPNLSVTEALPSLIPHLIGAVGGDIYFTQMKRGNLVFGGGPGWGDTALMRARP